MEYAFLGKEQRCAAVKEGARVRLTGFLFLIVFLLYGGGQSLIAPVVDGEVKLDRGRRNFTVGCALMLCNSLGVIVIGFLVKGMLGEGNTVAANAYLGSRFAEAALLAGGVVCMALRVSGASMYNFYLYHAGMVALASGSVILCRRMQEVCSESASGPSVAHLFWLFGGVAYFILAAGMCVDVGRNWDLFFHPDTQPKDSEIGIIACIPGAVFELMLGSGLLCGGISTAKWMGLAR